MSTRRPSGGTAPGERTDLAWTRTALGFLINAALVARFATHLPARPVAYAIAGLLATVAAALWAYGSRLGTSHSAATRTGAVTARPRALRAVWAATVAATVTCLALALWLLAQ